MAEVTPPLFQDVSGYYTLDKIGLPFRDLLGEGVVGSGDLAVTAVAGTMKTQVAKGVAWVLGDDDADRQPCYRCFNDAAVQLTHAAADATNPRIDIVVAQVHDSSFDTSGEKKWFLTIVEGTPAASPVAPATPNSAHKLAEVHVPANATDASTFTITDTRTQTRVGAGQAQGAARIVTKVSDLGVGEDGEQAYIRLMPATYCTANTALPASTIPVGDTTKFPTAGSATTPNGTIAWTGKTGTSLTGASGGTGTLSAGAAIVLSSGTPANGSYEFVSLFYDSEMGKWVSSEVSFPVSATMMNAITAASFTEVPSSQANLLTYGNGIPWRDYDAAGLKPQVKWQIGYGINTATPNGFQACPSFWGQNHVLAEANALVSNGADTNAAGPVGFNSNGGFRYETLWGNIPAGYTLKDFLVPSIQAKVSAGSATILNDPVVLIRWVG